MAKWRLSRRMWFAIGAVACGVLLPFVSLLALDIHVHHKFERGVLFNVWGYRGPVIGRKQPGEYRVAVLGGSAAFGFGVKWEDSMPERLEQKLAGRKPQIRVVNLAYNGESAYSFPITMDDYAYLNYDMVLMYEGYNDLFGDPSAPRQAVFRHTSPIFRLTGYMPVFPIVAREKASVMVYGDTRAVYEQAHKTNTVFTPGLATKTTAEMLRSAADVGESLERQLGRMMADAPPAPPQGLRADGSGCSGTWAAYCQLMFAAVTKARAQHKQVLVVTQPYLLGEKVRAAHQAQQQEMATMLVRDFSGDSGVHYLNLGDTVDVSDPVLSFDRMHLTELGNERIAAALVEPVYRMAGRAVN